jgi:DNA helicase-2/ATP-dependent DNA helicase PcrA
VGDEDQSIYAWRGACVENILDFPDDFPGAAIVKLEQNYRSTKRILTAANHVIRHNIGRREKTLWTDNPEGVAPLFFQGEDDRTEADFVIDRAEKTIRQGKSKAGEIAVFYRTHVQSRVLEEACRRRSLPYRVFGGQKFYDRAEIKDAFAYLRLLTNPHDDIAFERAVGTPSRGIGGKTLEQLSQTARAAGTSEFMAIPLLPPKGKTAKALLAFHSWLAPLTAERKSLGISELTERILNESGVLAALERENTIEAGSRIENLQELLRSMVEFEEETGGDLETYLDRISLLSDADRNDADTDTIVLMTMHNAKGLEYDHVSIVGMEEGVFPHARSLEGNPSEEIEEERRLCYVAMTRARKELTLTAAARRRLYQSVRYNPVSRFIGEIPPTLLTRIESPTLPSPRSHFVRDTADDYRQYSYEEETGRKPAGRDASSPYHPGTQVLHPDFGVGTIRKCEGNADNLKLTVQFRTGGTRKLLLNYCTLEVVAR